MFEHGIITDRIIMLYVTVDHSAAGIANSSCYYKTNVL